MYAYTLMHIRRCSYENIIIGMFTDCVYMCICAGACAICVDLYMCKNINVRVCPYIYACNAYLCTM